MMWLFRTKYANGNGNMIREWVGFIRMGRFKYLNENHCGPVRDAFGRNILFGLGFVPREHFIGSCSRQCAV